MNGIVRPELLNAGVLLLALLAIASRRLSLEWASLLLTLLAVLAGWLTPQQALAGFANPATFTVAAMFVISAALVRTGGLAPIERLLARMPLESHWQQLLLLALVVGPLSAVISNTAVVAMFIPVVERWSRQLGISASRLLMPLSFITVLAGVGTVLGTSSTLVASGLSEQLGYGRFGLLQFTPMALGVYGPAVLLLSLLAPRVLVARPESEPGSITTDYGLDGYLSELRVTPCSALVGKSLESSMLQHSFDVRVLAFIRAGEWYMLPLDQHAIQSDDLLLVRADPQQLLALSQAEGLEWPHPPLTDSDQPSSDNSPGLQLVEILIPPDSSLIGQTIMELRFAQRFNAVVLAIRRGRGLLRSRLGQVQLQLGDALLLQAPQPALRGLQVSRDLLLVTSAAIPEDRRDRLPWAITLTITALLLSLWRSEAMVIWTGLAVIGFLWTRVLTSQEIYGAIRWNVVILLAALLPLAELFQSCGGEHWLVEQLQRLSLGWPPYGLLVGLYVLTALLTELVSNQAAVTVMLPVGISLAQTSGLNAVAAMGVVTFAASHSFLTPIGYQTNTMIYAVGNYRFIDFLRLGLPLTLALAGLTPALAMSLFP